MYKIAITKKDIKKLSAIPEEVKSEINITVENGKIFIETNDQDIAAFLIYYLS